MSLFLFDVAPDPVTTGIGIAGLVFVAVVVLMITAGVLLGAVFLFKRIRKTSAQPGSRIVVGDVCLNLDKATTPLASDQSKPTIGI